MSGSDQAPAAVGARTWLPTRGRQPALFRRHGVDGADRRAMAAFAG